MAEMSIEELRAAFLRNSEKLAAMESDIAQATRKAQQIFDMHQAYREVVSRGMIQLRQMLNAGQFDAAMEIVTNLIDSDTEYAPPPN